MKTQFKVYRLHPTGPWHLSDQHQEDYSVSLRTIHSDTLHAAVCETLVKMGESIPGDGHLGFTTSSLFPYYQRDAQSNPIYFLPMPLRDKPWEADNQEDSKVRKTLKKIQWIDARLYGDILQGKELFRSGVVSFEDIKASYLTKESLPEDKQGSKDFIKSSMSVRVRLSDRTGRENAEPYNTDRIFFADHSGLFFIVQGDTTLLDKALSLLAHEGFGSDRSSGYGSFDYDSTIHDTIELDLPTQSEHCLALSLFIPENREQLQQMLSPSATYDFVRRGGWISQSEYSSLRKNAIYAFLPGSVFSCVEMSNPSVLGRIVDLKPAVDGIKHPIWRSGQCIMLPIVTK